MEAEMKTRIAKIQLYNVKDKPNFVPFLPCRSNKEVSA